MLGTTPIPISENGESYRSVFEETEREEESSKSKDSIRERPYNVKSLVDILGDNAEEKLKIKLFDAREYFEDVEER